MNLNAEQKEFLKRVLTNRISHYKKNIQWYNDELSGNNRPSLIIIQSISKEEERNRRIAERQALLNRLTKAQEIIKILEEA